MLGTPLGPRWLQTRAETPPNAAQDADRSQKAVFRRCWEPRWGHVGSKFKQKRSQTQPKTQIGARRRPKGAQLIKVLCFSRVSAMLVTPLALSWLQTRAETSPNAAQDEDRSQKAPKRRPDHKSAVFQLCFGDFGNAVGATLASNSSRNAPKRSPRRR